MRPIALSLFLGCTSSLHAENLQVLTYSDFISRVRDGNVESVEVTGRGNRAEAKLRDGDDLQTVAVTLPISYPSIDPLLSELLIENKVKVEIKEDEEGESLISSFLAMSYFWIFPFINLLLLAVLHFRIGRLKKAVQAGQKS